MKIIHSFIIICSLLLLCNSALAKDITVTRIIDGGLVQLDTGEMVKYAGIEAPSLGVKDAAPQFYAKEAKRYNHRLVFMKKVRLEFDKEKKDKDGNLLAYIFVKKTFVNAELVKLGYARANVVPPNDKYKDTLMQAERNAIQSEKGLWQEKKLDTEKRYVGNKRRYALHRPSCKYVDKIPEKSKIIFRNRTDAIKIGYIPCKVCKP